MVESRWNQSFFLREGLLLFLQSLNNRLPLFALGETFYVHVVSMELSDKFHTSRFLCQGTGVMKMDVVTHCSGQAQHKLRSPHTVSWHQYHSQEMQMYRMHHQGSDRVCSVLTTWTEMISPSESHGSFLFKPWRNKIRFSVSKSDDLPLDLTIPNTGPSQYLTSHSSPLSVLHFFPLLSSGPFTHRLHSYY